MKEEDQGKSFGELPTLGHEAEPERPAPAPDAPSWSALGLLEAETLEPAGGGIVDDGRADAGRRWKAGEIILGRYVVEGELGQGGMGVVYGCLDKVGGVRVAVKCLPPELVHNTVEMEEVRENFRLVCGLAHPNIAVVRQLERDERGEYYLVMELAEGESLRRWLKAKWKAGGVSLAEAVGVLRQVAAALDCAHGMKVVHRDVKPGNVMVDGKGRVKVLDFGLAAQIRTSLSRASQAYRGTSGTGPYMAPEQWRAQPQDAKTDQYALGVMAYEMLAGRLPFENSELAVLKDAVLNGEVPAIPGVPAGAMKALHRAMAKRAEERFGSCGEFVEALAKGGWGGRGRSTMGWAVALAVLAGALGAGVWWMGPGRETAGGKPAPPVETRQDASSPGTEAERKAEEARLAAEKAAEEEAARLEEIRIRAEREERILQENEEVEETVYRLEPMAKAKAANAAGMGYDRGQGFGEKLDEAKSKLEQGEAAMQARNFGKAKEYFEASMAAADWCAENAPLRTAARSAMAAAVAAKKKADALDGARLALQSYKRASEKAVDGKEAFAGARFKDAMAAWNAAVKGYGAAEEDARAEKVRQGLEAARGAERRRLWEECLAAAEGVLALEAGNTDAKRLKVTAEAQLKSILVVSASLQEGGASRSGEPGAKLEIGAKTYTLPRSFDCSAVATFGPGKVTLEKGGKTYAGTLARVKVDWKGKKSVTVPLESVVKTARPARAPVAPSFLLDAVAETARPGGAPRKGSHAGERMTVRVGACEVALRWCPEGTFAMGSPEGEEGRGDNETQHRVTLTRGFWMGETEVTQRLWREVMGNNPSYFKRWFKRGNNYPVESVSWEVCQKFVQALNSRYPQDGMRWALPTEAQWEYACRAGTGTAYFWGNALNGEKANCDGNRPCGTTVKGPHKKKTAPVGSYQPNAWGLFDMHGNVWEWCADWHTADLGTQSVTDPPGPSTGWIRVIRGGSWHSCASDCRSGYRDFHDTRGPLPSFWPGTLGLRVTLYPVQ